MEILGIGPSELIFIIIIALIVLGPKDMQKAGKTIGQWLNTLMRSDGWKIFQQTSRELRNLPTNLMREANMDLKETDDEIRRSIDPRRKPLASPSTSTALPSSAPLSATPSLPPSEKTDMTPQAPIINTPPEAPTTERDSSAQAAAIPDGESYAEDGVGSISADDDAESVTNKHD